MCREYIGSFMFVFVDDICLLSSNLEEHLEHLQKVFAKIRQFNLKVKRKKCNFAERFFDLLGYHISEEGIAPHGNKISTIKGIRVPKNVSQLCSFLGMTNYYRGHIKDYSKLAVPLIEMMKKHVRFHWGKEQGI